MYIPKFVRKIHDFFFFETNIIRTLGCIGLGIELFIFGGLMYVAFHFIGKYW